MEENNHTKEDNNAPDSGKVKKLLKKKEASLAEKEVSVDLKIENSEEKIEKIESEKESLEKKEHKVEATLKKEEAKLESLKKEEKKIESEEKRFKQEEKQIEDEEENIAFDLRKIKSIFKKKEKSVSKIEEKQEKKEEISFDPKKIWHFVVNNKTLLLLLIPIFFSIWFRAYPLYMPITDDWARDSVYNNIQSNIMSDISSQYPNLPDVQKAELMQERFKEELSKNNDPIEAQIASTSEYFKNGMRNEDGEFYLGDIDTWLWYGYTNNYVRYGHFGNEIINGESWYTLRNGREGQKTNVRVWSFLIAINYRIMNIFGEFSVMAATFYSPIFMLAIAAFAAFFVGKKIAGYPGAIAGSVIVAVHAALLSRTVAGVSDTDNLIACFSMLTVMFFVLAFEESSRKKMAVYTILAGISMGIYFVGHASWWHIFDFLIGASGAYLLYFAWSKKSILQKGIKGFIKIKRVQEIVYLIFGFAAATWISGAFFRLMTGGTFLNGLKEVITSPFLHPLSFIALKKVAVASVWPNVMTTVAELNTSSVSSVINQMGGKFLFLLSIIGIIYLFAKKADLNKERKGVFYGVLLVFWYLATIYAAQSSIRFSAMLVPAFAFAMCAFIGFIYNSGSVWLNKGLHINEIFSKVVIAVVVIIVVFVPLLKSAESVALREMPLMNDAWYDSLIGIKNDSPQAMITSWWDYGHWFVTVAERQVTFDGGDQGERIHWVGKSLLTSDEKLSVGILRMLNCGQEKAPHIVEKYVNNDTPKAIDIIYRIVAEDKQGAEDILENEGFSNEAIEEITSITHCDDLIPPYYITSDDMVGKAGVWGHFGSWNFTKAAMYNQVVKKDQSEGVDTLIKNFSLDEETANDAYYEIKTTPADQWVSPWPGYMASGSCSVKKNIVSCSNGLIVNLTSYEAALAVQGGQARPYSLVYADKNGVNEKVFSDSNIGVSAALIPNGNSFTTVLMDPLQAKSMFTQLYFFKGHGLECFDFFSYKKSFTGNEIYVWTVDWECQGKSILEQFKDKEEGAGQPEAESAAAASNASE